MRNEYLNDLANRLRAARGWVVGQFGGMLLLILATLSWTRLPDKHWWEVALSLLIPVLLAICVLELQAGTVRRLADDDGKRVKLVWGAVTLLVWIAVGAAMWALLDWCDDRIWLWASYLNSKASAHGRVTVFTVEHIQRWFTVAEWVLRWVVVPGKLIPLAAASAQWGWRLPARRLLRLLWSWQWWAAVVVAALIGAWLPGHFFAGEPSGTVSHQVWTVGLKLGGAYLLAMGSWVLILAWVATLFGRQQKKPPAEEVLVREPVPVGPPERSLRAKAETPIDPDEGPGTEGGPYNRHPKYPPGGMSG